MNTYRDRLNARRQAFADRLAIAFLIAVFAVGCYLLPGAIDAALVVR